MIATHMVPNLSSSGSLTRCHLVQRHLALTFFKPVLGKIMQPIFDGDRRSTPNRRKDQVYILDLIGVQMIDVSWLTKLPPELAARLQQILDTPDA